MFSLFCLITLLPYALLLGSAGDDLRHIPANVLTCALASCIAYHAAFLISCRKTGYSFLTVTCFFFWIFMALAPLMCSLTGRWLWGDITFELSEAIIKAQFFSFLFLAVFISIYWRAYKRGSFSAYLTTGGSVSDGRLFLGLWFSLGASMVVVIGLGIDGTFFRSGYDSYVATGVGALFIQNFFRPMPLLIGVPMLWVLLRDRLAIAKPRTWLAMTTVAMAVTVNFPLSVARFYGWTVISIFFYYLCLSAMVSRRHWIAGIFLLCGFLGSFVADAARYAKSATEVRQNYTSNLAYTTDSFYVGHVDAFEMLVYGTEYVSEKGPTMGRQALGVICFWVPRAWWPDKPQPTGFLMGTSFINLMIQTANTNLSAPIVLEGYINWGVPGLILFALIAGVVAGTLDRAIHERRTAHFRDSNLIFGIDAIAAPLMGLWVYLLRGSLLPAFAYTSGVVLAGVIMWKYFFRRSPMQR